ncbi:hypothetical protein VRK_01690 [Vibrio sp. MEBiC08052]|nr:hypothetical protein VRK_01690 [Vibrio sp. MEBiC08052]
MDWSLMSKAERTKTSISVDIWSCFGELISYVCAGLSVHGA